MVRVTLRSFSKNLSWGTVYKFTITIWEEKHSILLECLTFKRLRPSAISYWCFPSTSLYLTLYCHQVPDSHLIRKLCFHSFYIHVGEVYERTEFNSLISECRGRWRRPSTSCYSKEHSHSDLLQPYRHRLQLSLIFLKTSQTGEQVFNISKSCIGIAYSSFNTLLWLLKAPTYLIMQNDSFISECQHHLSDYKIGLKSKWKVSSET